MCDICLLPVWHGFQHLICAYISNNGCRMSVKYVQNTLFFVNANL